LPRPSAILVATAHWTTRDVQVSSGAVPATIHDFSGFPDELYAMRYPAPGSPALAQRTATLLATAGMTAHAVDRGFDHGVWVPLMLMYPDADIPVVALSVQPHRDGDHHVALGKALAPLRAEGVLIVGSGSATHNLRELDWSGTRPPPDWASAFDDWLVDVATRGDLTALADWTERAPHARRNHPTPEHFLPCLVAAGAGSGPGQILHRSMAFGSLAMTALAW
jgi:4,5-DOPA dioxygenase extradiol